MPPTKMLPVCGSLREFQELHSSSQDLQNQRRPHQVFSRCSKQTLTKKAAGLVCLALFCAGTVFLEYKMLLLFGAAFVVFAAACALAVISGQGEMLCHIVLSTRNSLRELLIRRAVSLKIRVMALFLRVRFPIGFLPSGGGRLTTR
jgi:hypothetical protein